MVCDRDCFNCNYQDCVTNNVTREEILDQNKRDTFARYEGKYGRSLVVWNHNHTEKGKETLRRYNSSEKGKQRHERYISSDKGKEMLKRKNEKRNSEYIESGKNAENCRNYYRRKKEELGMKVRSTAKMECVFCKKTNVRVVGSIVDGNRIIRERKCDDCGKKFYTQEVGVEDFITLRYEYNRLRDDRYKAIVR